MGRPLRLLILAAFTQIHGSPSLDCAGSVLEQGSRARAWIPFVGRDWCLYSFNILPNKHFSLRIPSAYFSATVR
eukprot:3092291-Rhodomonas_salina.1